MAEAERLFAEGGYAGTSLSSVARAAGLGNAGLIHHFPTKAAVYRAVLESIGADLDARDARALESGPSAVERLHGLVGAVLALGEERPTALTIIAHELFDRSNRIDTAGTFPLAAVVRDTVDVLAAGQVEGTVRPGDPVAMTAALHGALLQGTLGRAVYARTTDRKTDGPSWPGTVSAIALAALLTPSGS